MIVRICRILVVHSLSAATSVGWDCNGSFFLRHVISSLMLSKAQSEVAAKQLKINLNGRKRLECRRQINGIHIC